MYYFDTHAHYDDAAFDADRDALIKEMYDFGIKKIINVGADMQSSLKSIELAEKYAHFYAAVGVHPYDVTKMCEDDTKLLQKYCKYYKTVAVGEIGLDYHYEDADREKQKYWFKKQLELAKNVGKPVIIHSRDAAEETFETIAQSRVRSGVIHAFSGSAELAKEYVKLGFYIGIGGVVTFKNAKKLVRVATEIPLSRILLETDAPYLSPEPYRGKRNNSQNLQFVAAKIGEIKQIDTEVVINLSSENAEMLFLS
ncbi:MAG: TatD family hydrolase [Firmicutes bacterium]|nr:TatD family hydrolase [Bacillota bacterium]